MESMPTLFKKHKLAIFSFLFVFCIWLLFFFITPNLPSNTVNNFGVLGDSFNIITSLFTGLAFAGVIISVILQTQELKLQRKELQETREELRGQKEQLKKQQQEMVNQSFDNKFFQMLNMFNTNVTNLEAGKETISGLKNELIERINDVESLGEALCEHEVEESEPSTNPEAKAIENFNATFKQFNEGRSNILRPYFINLYQILKYVDEKVPIIPLSDKINMVLQAKDNQKYSKEYVNIIRAQLSSDELVLLLYHAIGVIQLSGTKYKKLLEKYAFFEHLSIDYLYNINEALTLCTDYVLEKYDKKVAGKNTPLKEKIEELQSKIKNQGTK